jgi:CheY-like chemotaxis protein
LARKILLADDSVTAQNMGRKILADAGYDVVTVNNGSAALKRIAELKPDLIVLDVYMPGYSGLEVCQRLKDGPETARIPVLLTVGKLEPFKAEEARRVKADGHIVKPFEASELLTAIVRLEERMGPPQPAVSDVSPDTGWPSRLSVPSKKKKSKDEEVQDAGASAAFRDFRREKGKADADGAPATTGAPFGRNPDLVPDIPDDVTAEELDALSALAAKLDGLTPAAEDNIPHAAEHTVPPAEQELEAPAPAVEPVVAATEATFAVEPAAVETTFAVEPAAFGFEGKSEYEIPVENPVETEPAVEDHSFVAVNSAHEVQEPAPVDRNDEPMFASSASAVEQPDTPTQAETEEVPSDTELTAALSLLTPAAGHEDDSTMCSHADLPEETAAHDAEGARRWVAEPVALSPEEAAISLEAEMFRTFAAIPAAMPAEMPEAMSAATPEVMPEVMLETVPPTMYEPTSAPTTEAEADPAPIVSVSAIAAAVASRLAEAEVATSSEALAGQTADSEAESSQTVVAEATTEAAPVEAEPMATASVAESQAEKKERVAPLAMAAAAAADGAASDGDAGAIANIVDSVLADLRPKLLEEIAKKLTRK